MHASINCLLVLLRRFRLWHFALYARIGTASTAASRVDALDIPTPLALAWQRILLSKVSAAGRTTRTVSLATMSRKHLTNEVFATAPSQGKCAEVTLQAQMVAGMTGPACSGHSHGMCADPCSGAGSN